VCCRDRGLCYWGKGERCRWVCSGATHTMSIKVRLKGKREITPKRAVSLLARIFNSVLRTHQFPQMWKHARVISILKPGKDPALPSSHRPISLLDTIGKLFEKILLARILHVVNERGLMRDEQFGFRPRHSTSLLLARLVDRIIRNFGEKSLTGAVFFDVAKAFDTVWMNRWLPLQANALQLPVLHSPYNLILPQGSDVRSVLPDGHVISSRHAGWGS